jgi:hypothetical protein
MHRKLPRRKTSCAALLRSARPRTCLLVSAISFSRLDVAVRQQALRGPDPSPGTAGAEAESARRRPRCAARCLAMFLSTTFTTFTTSIGRGQRTIVAYDVWR